MLEEPKSFSSFASVIFDLNFDRHLDYGIPEHLLNHVKPGSKVSVPLRGHLKSGFVIAIKDRSNFSPVQPIHAVLSNDELITSDLFELAVWMASYYCVSLRQALLTILPATIKNNTKHKEQLFVMRNQTKEQLRQLCEEIRNQAPKQAAVLEVMLQTIKGILLSELLELSHASRSSVDALVEKGALSVDIVRVDRSPLQNAEYFATKPKQLNAEQEQALHCMTKSLNEHTFEVHLLHGITGSGKTEVYLQAIDQTLRLHRGVIMLVPEISLTTQMIERFRSRFEGQIAILHHRLSQGERFDEWHRIRRAEAKIVIGARSAIFSPVQNLGLIIVDEEHENSYKQSEEAPCYHARDVAIIRGKINRSTVVLGSATPALETFFNTERGKYKLSTLSKRPCDFTLPKVTIVDMKIEFQKAKGFTLFSDALLGGIEKRHENGEQTILFLNRRGYHTSQLCQECGYIVSCNHCDTGLTFHKGDNKLSCHLCGYEIAPPPHCSQCKSSKAMKFRGVGTEQVEKAIHAIFPEIRTTRLDADTTKHKGSHQRLLRQFGTGKADVMIGTQMIAKGLHFPEVTLVGVLNCDSALNIPDFRSSETVFQLITQVAGRSGRGNLPGEVIIQTSIPENQTIQCASKQDYHSFYKEELSTRKMFAFPPFTHLVKVNFSGPSELQVKSYAEQIQKKLVQHLPSSFEIHPIMSSGHARVKDHFRFHFLIKGKAIYALNQLFEELELKSSLPKAVKMFVDVDPTSIVF